MQQLTLPMLTVYKGPRLIEENLVRACATYRDAVRLCWAQRARRNMTQRVLAEEADLYPSHASDYLSDNATRRELPAKAIDAFERVCGNRAVTQWLLLQVERSDDEVEALRRAA